MSTLVDGQYRVIRQLGAGTMGSVYLGHDEMLDRRVALKVIDPELVRDPLAVTRFRREARALAQVESEHVVRVYAFGPYGQSFYFAMEYVEGVDLETLLERHLHAGTRFPLATTVSVVAALASGLASAHARAITHRDVKPSNVVIENGTGRPVLIDFGIAKHVSSMTPRITASAGTPPYMAPEQVRNDPNTGAAADVYALGCLAFEMLTGRLVFPYEDVGSMLRAHLEETPRLVSSVRPELFSFDPVFERVLAKEPGDRHPSAVAFAEALAHASRHASDRAPRPSAKPNLHVLVLASDVSFRRTLVRETARVVEAIGGSMTVTCVDSQEAARAAIDHTRTQLVLLDDDAANGRALDLVPSLARGTTAVLLTRDLVARSARAKALGAHCLAKPVNRRSLRSVLEAPARKLAS